MYLMYVDESGDVGLVNSPTRYFVLVGLVLHELRWKQTLDELLAFRQELKKDLGLKLREEIHASPLLTRPGELARIPKHRRLEILRRFADKIASMPDLNLVCVTVDKNGKPPGYDVFEHAWQALIQRFENTLSHQNFAGPKNADDRGMLFPDHTSDKKLNALLRKMRSYNPVPNQSGNGYRNLLIRSVIEDANFRDSGLSYLIQAADVAAYLLYQSLSPSAYIKKKSGQNYFNRLSPVVCKVVAPRADGIVKL
ncbi:MAG: hypothetical protein JWN23_802 [Rhodocyclales bacterium]|nr:hypothetical protein [Rhodocyclales bacterium]